MESDVVCLRKSNEKLDLRANPFSRVGDRPPVELVFLDRLIVLGDYHQREFRWPGADPERSLCRRNHAREQPSKSRHPFQVRVAVIRTMIEERNPGGRSELRCVVKLEPAV